jgi:hypothetical protein
METNELELKIYYNKYSNQLTGLLKGDIVTFLLIHTKYYLNPKNDSSETKTVEETVSASIIKIKRGNGEHNKVYNIIDSVSEMNHKMRVVTTIQFKLLVKYRYNRKNEFDFNSFDKIYIEIFIDNGNNPSANYKLQEQMLKSHIKRIRGLRKPQTDIESIKDYLSSITKNEQFNNYIIKYINILEKIQFLSNYITTELNKVNDITNIDELKPISKELTESNLNILKQNLELFTKMLETEMVDLLNRSGVTTNNVNQYIIKDSINLQFKNPSNYLDLETTSQNATEMIVIMKEVINNLKSIDFDNAGSDNEDAITKIKNIYERFYKKPIYASSTGRREANVIEVKPNKETTDTTKTNSAEVTKYPPTEYTLPLNATQIKRKQALIRDQKNRLLKKNNATNGGKRLNNNHNKSIKKPKK